MRAARSSFVIGFTPAVIGLSAASAGCAPLAARRGLRRLGLRGCRATAAPRDAEAEACGGAWSE